MATYISEKELKQRLERDCKKDKRKFKIFQAILQAHMSASKFIETCYTGRDKTYQRHKNHLDHEKIARRFKLLRANESLKPKKVQRKKGKLVRKS
jgi:hypothetical protein